MSDTGAFRVASPIVSSQYKCVDGHLGLTVVEHLLDP